MLDTITAEVDLGENGGRRTFRSYDDVRSFALEQREAWSWLRDAHEPTGHQSHMPDRIDALLGAISASEQGGRSLHEAVADLPGYFQATGNSIVHHESALGSELLAIRDLISPSAASFAYAFNRGWAQLPNANTPELLKGALALVAPGVLANSDLVTRFARERANYRAELRRVMAEAEAAEANRAAATAEAFLAGRASIRRWAGKRAMRWHHYSLEQKAATESAIDQINTVKKTYEESMALQAPSKYWRDKAKIHKRSETWAAWRLAGFFIAAGVGLTIAFFLTATFFLQAEADPRTSVYFVASAGLATVAGLVLWLGRLLTRLYLSEHHLRKDAEERRIMTTTYLALMRKGAAEDKDRQVILSALFRNSSDGIVKDDGAADIGLSALVSRLGIPTR